MGHTYNVCIQTVEAKESGVQGHYLLYIIFKVTLGYPKNKTLETTPPLVAALSTNSELRVLQNSAHRTLAWGTLTLCPFLEWCLVHSRHKGNLAE